MAEAYRTFGQFILFKEVLKDCTGHLYRAGEFDAKGVKRTVWLRVLDGRGLVADDVIRAFDDARQVGKILQAANIASGSTFHVEDAVPAFAVDYVASQPLGRLFAKVKEEGFPVPVDNALLIMEKLALGLTAGLVVDRGGQPLAHGFLHPSMVVVTNDGESIICGFGLGESLLALLDDAEAADDIKPYLAPEVIESRTSGKKGDVYSLGAILFQLLTSVPLPADPAARQAAIDGAEMAYDGDPVPADIMTVLAKALAPRAENRYSSAADFKKELDKLLYGGNYSPTTFNLALFMDRLFRTDIEADELDRGVEAQVDVAPFLQPEPEEEIVETAPVAAKPGKGLYYAIGAAVVVVLAVVGFFLTRGSNSAPPPPTPEEVAAQRAAQEEQIRQLAARMVEEKMQEQEDQMRGELAESQKRIEDLQKKLQDSQRKTASADEKRQAEALQKQIQAEKEKQRQKEAAMEKERKEALAKAQKEAAERAKQQLAATPAPEPTAVKVAEVTPTPQAPVAPTPRPVTVTENQFIDPTQADTLPAILKEEAVVWPASAKRGHRRGMVIVQATVTASGEVEAVKVLRADEMGFGIPEAVTDAVKKYLFKPGTKDGVKIKTYATVTKPYNFR